MYGRRLLPKLKFLAGKFPVVILTGPRQSGKTTLARLAFPAASYVSLEPPAARERAIEDPEGFLDQLPPGAIIDEAQRAPDLLSYIQTRVDHTGSAGRYILTGSQQFHLLATVSQTLAGRAAHLRLMPLSLSELRGWTPIAPERFGDETPRREDDRSLDELLFSGLYPGLHARRIPPGDFHEAYTAFYVERDVREVLRVADLSAFQRFVRLCAGRTGQILNLSALASDCGITHPTARAWLSVLEASSLVFLLKPFHRNFSKRLIQSPKLYFLDTGLVCHLLRLRGPQDLRTHPLYGSIFETFVVSELYKAFVHQGSEPPLSFWRDHTGHEVDLVVELGARLVPVEVKAARTVSSDAFQGLNRWLSLKGNTASGGVLVHAGTERHRRGALLVKTWRDCS